MRITPAEVARGQRHAHAPARARREGGAARRGPSGPATSSRSAIVGSTSEVAHEAGSTGPPSGPAAFTKNGTGAISSTLRSVTSRRSSRPPRTSSPWSAVTTIRARRRTARCGAGAAAAGPAGGPRSPPGAGGALVVGGQLRVVEAGQRFVDLGSARCPRAALGGPRGGRSTGRAAAACAGSRTSAARALRIAPIHLWSRAGRPAPASRFRMPGRRIRDPGQMVRRTERGRRLHVDHAVPEPVHEG